MKAKEEENYQTKKKNQTEYISPKFPHVLYVFFPILMRIKRKSIYLFRIQTKE